VRFLSSLLLAASAASATELDLSGWTLEEKAGQLLMVGFRSFDQVKAIQPGGVVLFSWNMKSVDETRELTRSLREYSATSMKSPLFVATDHEGGKVLRLRKGLTAFPDAAAVGATGDVETAFRVGKTMGQELASLGINMNLAPVLDLGNARSFLENRVWGESGGPVGTLTTAYMRGLESARVLAVAKHFPGHGGSAGDSHFTLPRVTKSFQSFWNEDLEPFRKAVKEGVQAVMTAHVEVPAIDAGPASLSSKFVTTLLREQFGFQGLVLTDDLEMGGVTPVSGTPVEDLALRSLKAGTDLVLVVWSEKSQRKVRDRIVRAVREGELTEAWLDEKVRRISHIRQGYSTPYGEGWENPFWKENLRRPESITLADSIPERALQWIAGRSDQLSSGFSQAWDSSWMVMVPEGPAVRLWRKLRPADEILSHHRRSDSAAVARLERKLREAIAKRRPVIVVTGPRASSSEDAFRVFRKHLGREGMRSDGTSLVLWVHQGSRPVDFKLAPEDVKIGLVGLHSTSLASLMALTETLRGPAPSSRVPAGRGWN
jgi:beta-N-acetylhexosaminidase